MKGQKSSTERAVTIRVKTGTSRLNLEYMQIAVYELTSKNMPDSQKLFKIFSQNI